MAKKLGKCKVCGVQLTYDKKHPVGDNSNVGDYDFICYPCQFRAMDNGTWAELKDRYFRIHKS